MRIAVVGAGGVGGGFGAALAKAGAEVVFIARGAHLAAMKSEGLKVQGGRGETHLVPTRATDDPAEIGKVDIVLFCVKLWDVESAGLQIRPLIGPDTAVIPLQNGIDAAERLILTELWMKFILLASNASVMALARQPIGKLRDDPDLRPIFLAAWQETIDVGRASGVALPADALDKILDFTSHVPPAMKASMALDLDRGNRLELPWLGGKVVELGLKLGVPTPTHGMMYAMLKPYVMGTPT